MAKDHRKKTWRANYEQSQSVSWLVALLQLAEIQPWLKTSGYRVCFFLFFFASSVFLFYEQRVFQLLKVIETHLRGDMFIDNAYYDSLVTHFLKPLSTVSAMSFHFTTCTSSSIFNRLYWLPSIRWANKIQLNLQCCKMHNSRYIRYLLQIPVLFFPCLPVFLDTCILWASRRGFPFIWGRTFVFEGLRNHVEMFITIIFPKVDK